MEIKGTVYEILPTLAGRKSNGAEWEVARFVIKIDDPHSKYDSFVMMQCFSEEKLHELGIEMGRTGTFLFNISARKAGTTWFNSVAVWKTIWEDNRNTQSQYSAAQKDRRTKQPKPTDSPLPF